MVFEQPQQEPRVDAAGARRHNEAVEWCEAHRRVDRQAARHGRQRGARAEMARDDAQRLRVTHHQLRGAPGGVRVGESVKAVPAPRPLGRERVGRGAGGQRRVERRVEARGRAGVRQPLGERGDRGDRSRLVQRRELGQFDEAGAHVTVDPGGGPQVVAAVYDAVGDGVGVGEAVEGVVRERLAGRPLGQALGEYAVVAAQRGQFQAARAGVDDQQPHALSRATSSCARPPGPRRTRACMRGGGGARRACAGAAPPPEARGPVRGRSRQ